MKKELNNDSLEYVNGGCYRLFNEITGKFIDRFTFKSSAMKAIKKYTSQGMVVRVDITDSTFDDSSMEGIYTKDGVYYLTNRPWQEQ